MSESEHFKHAELACHCCGVNDCKPELLAALEQLRSVVGKPILILSGYRCPKHNKAVGGVPKSEHVQGIAADVSWGGATLQEKFDAACQVKAFFDGGIGVYDRNFIHVDVRDKRARWAQVSGKYVGIEQLVKENYGI